MDVDDAEERALAAQRHREPGADISQFEPFARDGLVAKRLGLAHIGDVDDAFAAREGIIEPARSAQVAWAELAQLLEGIGFAMRGDEVEQPAVEAAHRRLVGFAQL